MKKVVIIVFALLVNIVGCASSSDLAKDGDYHGKSGRYYESIGQPQAAEDEYKAANDNYEKAGGIFPILVELLGLLGQKD